MFFSAIVNYINFFQVINFLWFYSNFSFCVYGNIQIDSSQKGDNNKQDAISSSVLQNKPANPPNIMDKNQNEEMKVNPKKVFFLIIFFYVIFPME